MRMTIEYFLTKRITILKEMLERLPDDSEFNRGVRSAYKDELFVCESVLTKQQATLMNDQDVLHGSMEYCNNHYDEQSRCDKCPLKGNVCIDRYGDISFNYGKRRMSFIQFTEQFRKMVNILE